MKPRLTPADADDSGLVGQWLLAALVLINLSWTTLGLGGFLAQTMVVTSALNGLLLAVHFLVRACDRTSSPLHPASWLFFPFLGYGLISVLWITPVRWLGWMDWLGWGQMILVFWVVINGVRARAIRQMLFVGLVAIGAILVLLAAYQRFRAPDWLMLGRLQVPQFIGRSSGSFGLPNALAAYLVLILPPVAALMFRQGASVARRLVWGYLTAALAFALLLTISRGAWIALGLVLIVTPLFAGRVSPLRRLARASLAALGVMVIVGVLYLVVAGAQDRLTQLQTQGGEMSRPIMWRAALAIAREQPLWGSGAGSYAISFDQYRPADFQLEPRWAHNEYLNTLSDFGVVGFGLLSGAGAWLLVGCRRRRGVIATGRARDPTRTIGGWMGIAAFLIQLAVDFSLKIPALGMAFAAMLAVLVRQQWSVPQPVNLVLSRGRIWLMISLAAAVLTLTFFLTVPFYQAEGIRQTTKRSMDRMGRAGEEPATGSLTKTRDHLLTASQMSPKNGYIWADLAYVTSLLARSEPARALELGRDAERFANRALDCSTAVANFWVRRSVALDLQGRWVEAGGDLVKALELAPTRGSVWFQQAVHLSLDRTDPARALAAVSFCLRLDPGNREAHALRERLAERSHAP